MDNRLTKTYENGSYGVADDLPCGENSHDFKRLLVDKMGAYESLGTPAELESLQRERDAYYENAKYTEAAFHEVTKLRAEVESLQRERDKWKESYESEQTDKWDARSERDDISEAYSNKVDECESLQRDKAALIEVLEEVSAAPVPNYYTEYHPLVKLVRAARTILARMKGDTHA